MQKRSVPKRRSAADRAAAARMLEILRAGGDVRRPKIARIKSSIGRRSYESSLKMEITIDRLLEALQI